MCFQLPKKDFRPEVCYYLSDSLPFSQNYVTSSEGAVSHNFVYNQQLSIACYQVSFNANSYFEQLPIVSIAFKPIEQGPETKQIIYIVYMLCSRTT